MNLDAHTIEVEYGGETVLDVRRLHVDGPGLVVVMGPNGAGKSTLLRLFAGLQRPGKGKVEVNGVDAHRRKARLACGYSPDHPVLFDDLTIADNIAYAHESSGSDQPADIAKDLIDAFGLANMLRRFPSQLSRGQQQAASLVVAAARPVEVLLLDEPTLALDKDNRHHLSEVAAAHADHQLLMVASHEQTLIDLGKRSIQLVGGRVK